MDDAVLTVSATEFRARCLALFKALEAGKLARVVVTRRGKPVAELVPPRRTPVPNLWGAHPGSVRVAPGVDLTEPVLDEPLDAEAGILHR